MRAVGVRIPANGLLECLARQLAQGERELVERLRILAGLAVLVRVALPALLMPDGVPGSRSQHSGLYHIALHQSAARLGQ